MLSPCASPVLAVILTVAAVQGEVAYGSTLLFAYALGQGTLINLAGTFTGVINNFLQSRGAQVGARIQQVAVAFSFSPALICSSRGFVPCHEVFFQAERDFFEVYYGKSANSRAGG